MGIPVFGKKAKSADRIWSIPGGIHPPENKEQSNATAITAGPLPTTLVMPLQQHIGAPAKPCVAVGEHVLKGQQIATAQGPVSAPVHASSSGVVVAIEPRPVQHPSGIEGLCVVIETDGEDRWFDRQPVADYKALQAPELLQVIREAGISGMGGAGFPAAIKLNTQERPIEQLIMNSVECEPYITADDRLIRERAEQLVAGLQILQHLVQPQQTLIGIEDNKPQAIEALQTATADTDIKVMVVPTKYPSGGEKQLIQLLTGKEVPSGGLPSQVGVVCQNTGSVYAIYRAIIKGEPLISRITTLTGEALGQLGNREVLLGTQVSDLVVEAQLDEAALERLIMGGPMMGFTLHNPQVPVVKTTNCIIAASAQELPEPPPEQPCIRCGTCAEYCPASLLPQQLYWFSKSGEYEKAQHYNLMDCIECGVCSYVCPSNIPLVQYFRFGKSEVRKLREEKIQADHSRQRFEARQQRLEAEAQEKAARKKAREEARKAKASEAPAANAEAEQKKMAALKKAQSEASKLYKAAVKALKEAEAAGETDLQPLQKELELSKAAADQAKAAVREAKANVGSTGKAAASADDALKALKAEVGTASSAYKAAVKALKEAEADGQDDLSELQQQVDQRKAVADSAKAQLRAARAGEMPAAAPADEVKAKAEAELTTIKTAAATRKKQYKEAAKALAAARLSELENLPQLESQVAQLKALSDDATEALKQALLANKDKSPAKKEPK